MRARCQRRVAARRGGALAGSENAWLPSGACALFVCDVVSYGDSRRTDLVQAHIRRNLYGLLETSFERAEIPFGAAYREDRGDGVMLAVPPEHDPALLVTAVVDRLRADLGRYNELASEAARIELRVAAHLGIATHDGEGLVGTEVNHVFRLLEAPLLKGLVKDTGIEVGLIVSERFYDEVVRRDTGLISAKDYWRVPVAVKETECAGWLRLFGGAVALGGALEPMRQDVPGTGLRTSGNGLEPRFAAAAGDAAAGPAEEVDGASALFEIVELTLAIPSMLTESRREEIVGELPHAIAVVIPRSSNARSDVYQIIRTCLDYPGGLQHFLRAVKLFVGDSMPVTRLEQTIARLLSLL